jgi:hypothetical protein
VSCLVFGLPGDSGTGPGGAFQWGLGAARDLPGIWAK